MNFDDPFEIDFRPAVPASVRSELNKLLRGTTRIVVNKEAVEGKQTKANALRLNTKPTEWPSEPTDEIAEAIIAIMHVAWSAQAKDYPDDDLPPMMFVVICEQAGKTSKRPKRTQFKYAYKGEHEPDYLEDAMSTEERSVHRALELLERMLDKAHANNADSHELLLRIVQQYTASSSAGSDLLREAIPLFLSGFQQTLNASQLQFSAHQAEAQTQATTERIKAAMEMLGPFVGIAFQQLATKYGFPMPPPGDDDSDADDQEGALDEPLAAVAQHFGEGLDNRQRAELNRVLTKKQSACFDAMFCAATDAEAFAAYQQIGQHAADKLVVLQALLNVEQGHALAAFMKGAAKYAAQQPSPT